jgi:hypothetical protein
MSRTSPVPFTLQEGLHCERGAAKIFGTDCAIVLQRFIWWTYPNKSKFGALDENGNKWVYFTMDDLVEEFDWMSKSTLWRIINLLEENHILLSKQPEGKASRRKHYSISWPMWLKIQSGAYSKIGKDGKLIPSQIDIIPSGQIEEVGSLQIEGMGSLQIDSFPSNLELPRTHLEKEPSAPSRYLQPDKEDLETASLKAAPSPKAEGTPSSAAPQKPARKRDPLLDWLAQMGGANLNEVTPSCWSKLAKALSEIRSVAPDVTVDELARRAKNLELKWNFQPTAMALAKNWADANLMPDKPKYGSPKATKPVWLQIKELEARIESHVANHNRLGYDSSLSTPEAKEEWKRLKQTLKDLQAGQPQAEEGGIP